MSPALRKALADLDALDALDARANRQTAVCRIAEASALFLLLLGWLSTYVGTP